jgi:hypothetical protein
MINDFNQYCPKFFPHSEFVKHPRSGYFLRS